MNEKDIYELIGNSYNDKIKLDFDDVKKRIAALPENKITPITSVAPSAGSKKKAVFTAVSAAAACLVCIIALSAVLSQPKSDSAAMESEAYFNAAADTPALDGAAYYSSDDCFTESVNESVMLDDYADSDCEANGFDSFNSALSPSDCISDTDISPSDIN